MTLEPNKYYKSKSGKIYKTSRIWLCEGLINGYEIIENNKLEIYLDPHPFDVNGNGFNINEILIHEFFKTFKFGR